jgi:hypothetical protein
MPSTKQLVNWIKLNANGWNRIGEKGIVPLINEAQNILMQHETPQMVKRDPLTGEFPSFDTVAGTYEYEMPSDVWRVSQILAALPLQLDYNLPFSTYYGMNSNVEQPMEDLVYHGKRYVRIPYVTSRDSFLNQAATVEFKVDPGTSTGVYLYLGYIRPTQIMSESINPSLPEKFHMTHLLPATMKLIEAMQFGNWTDGVEYISNRLAKQIRDEQWNGENGFSHTMERREI